MGSPPPRLPISPSNLGFVPSVLQTILGHFAVSFASYSNFVGKSFPAAVTQPAPPPNPQQILNPPRVIVSCGKYRIFPCTLSSFRQCAEHLGELLQRSWVKPKLLSRPAPRASPFYPQHSSPARRVSLNQSQNKQTHIGFRVLPLALPSRNPRLHNNGAETYGPTGATRTQQLCERDEVCTHQS